jgi:hypothetical protein
MGAVDSILVAHDHHADNLDHAGRARLAKAKTVRTTEEGSQRLGGNSQGLGDWQPTQLAGRDGRILHVTATK